MMTPCVLLTSDSHSLRRKAKGVLKHSESPQFRFGFDDTRLLRHVANLNVFRIDVVITLSVSMHAKSIMASHVLGEVVQGDACWCVNEIIADVQLGNAPEHSPHHEHAVHLQK